MYQARAGLVTLPQGGRGHVTDGYRAEPRPSPPICVNITTHTIPRVKEPGGLNSPCSGPEWRHTCSCLPRRGTENFYSFQSVGKGRSFETAHVSGIDLWKTTALHQESTFGPFQDSGLVRSSYERYHTFCAVRRQRCLGACWGRRSCPSPLKVNMSRIGKFT